MDKVRRWFPTSEDRCHFKQEPMPWNTFCCDNNSTVFYAREVTAPLESQQCTFSGEAL